MSVKVCAGPNDCITCSGTTVSTIEKEIEAAKKAGHMFYCCETACIAIDKITTVTEVEEHPAGGFGADSG